MSAALDHLVVIADTLDAGVAWCEQTLGVTPGPGGQHPLMGTHNRLLRLDGPDWPRAYLEIIAIEPGVAPLREPPLRRWFDMDDAALMARVRAEGPQLLHWVARTANLTQALNTTRKFGWERGEPIQASRMTPQGLLSWQISVRSDGQRLLGGVLPTLIEWGAVHPADAMPASGVALREFELQHPEPAALQAWSAAIGLGQVAWSGGPAALRATLDTPRGPVQLLSMD